MSKTNPLLNDLYNIIDNDLYAWFCVWGPPRTGKSTLCLLIAFWIYKDWDSVLNCIVFSLNGLLYKLEKGEPVLWPTRNDLHKRVPFIFIDDFGAHCNKAKTQHERGWDVFKGGFDTLGTKLGVLMANMVSPSEATQQLQEKYTHEIFVHSRGQAKYDKVHQQQDYKRWESRRTKEWRWEFDFEEIPKDVFKQYDEMRCQLADEVLFSINETIVIDQISNILNRIQPMDVNLLSLIRTKGLMYHRKIYDELGEESRDAITRMKSRGLIVPKRAKSDTGYYLYDITDLGRTVLEEYEKDEHKESVVASKKSKFSDIY